MAWCLADIVIPRENPRRCRQPIELGDGEGQITGTDRTVERDVAGVNDEIRLQLRHFLFEDAIVFDEIGMGFGQMRVRNLHDREGTCHDALSQAKERLSGRRSMKKKL